MSTKKKTRAKAAPNKKKVPPEAVLSVEILQFGCPQSTGKWSSKRFFSKVITFGVSRRSDLHLPYTKLPLQIKIFEIKNGKVFAVLDPRVEGFVNRGREFGDVKEFLSPRGALAEVSTIDDPLRLELQLGSRGSIRIYGFEVIFKYDIPLPEKTHLRVEGAGSGFFIRPDIDTPLEAYALWFAMAALACALIPFFVWLGMAKANVYGSFASLPQDFLLRIISPEHYPSLPRLLDANFRPGSGSEGVSFTTLAEEDSDKDPRREFRRDIAVRQAAYVVAEYQRRWRLAEDGVYEKSDVDINRFPSPVSLPTGILERWKHASDLWYARLRVSHSDPASERYYLYQVEPPRLGLVTTGERRGSIRVRLEKRIAQLRLLHRSIVSLVGVEQEFLRKYYSGNIAYQDTKNVYLGPIFQMPAPSIFSAKPEQRFVWEVDRYQSAQALSEYAASLSDRLRSVSETNRSASDSKVRMIWLERDGTLTPTFVGVHIDSLSGAESAIVQNAKYSIAERPIPPPPPPTPRVDEQSVKLVILGKREQIKACYESLLRRNPKANGTIRFSWVIDKNGRAQDPKVVSGSFSDRELQMCLRARLLQWQFPKPENGIVTFEYPFQFVTKFR